jgi:ribosomal protein S18 acetylase RimI-like enzyme
VSNANKISFGMIGSVISMHMKIQYSISADLQAEELDRLLFAASNSTYSAQELAHIISGSTAYVTARDSGRLVGFGRMLSDGAVLAYINNMAVSPDYQRQGIGQTILDTLIEVAGEVKSIFIYSNTADSLYVRNGFQLSEKRLYVRRRRIAIKQHVVSGA